jgi:hypothetical protein
MTRLENGLIEGLNYVRDEKTKRIDWLRTLPIEHVYINPDKKSQLEKSLNKKFEDIKINEVKDTDIILILSGIRWLLDIRGYKYVKMTVNSSNLEYSAVTCEICFLPIEGEGEQIFTACASAHFGNTANFARQYLLEIASNRALARCCRNALGISSISREELGASIEQQPTERTILSDSTQIKLLTDIMDAKKVNWNLIKEKLKSENKFDESWTSVEKLPKDLVFELINRLKKKS